MRLLRERYALTDGLGVSFAAEEPVDHHYGIACGTAMVVVQLECKLNDRRGAEDWSGSECAHAGEGVALLNCARAEWFASLERALSVCKLRSVECMLYEVFVERLFRDRGVGLFLALAINSPTYTFISLVDDSVR